MQVWKANNCPNALIQKSNPTENSDKTAKSNRLSTHPNPDIIFPNCRLA